MPLSDKQQVFIAEYLKCWSATKAARLAGYSEKYLHTNANKLLQNTTIAAEIEHRKTELIMSADEALTRLTEHARGAHGDYITSEGRVDVERLVADGKAYLIKAVKETKYGLILEFPDAQTALLNIGKQHGLFSDQHVVTVKLEKEIDAILEIAKQVLSPDAYNSLLAGIGGETDSPTAAE